MRQASVNSTTVHGIPMKDALMGIYASYYVGATQRDPTVTPLNHSNTDLDGRAGNTFNMTGHMRDYFARPDSPFIVLDDSTQWLKRNGYDSLGERIREIGNGYFVTLYHKQSGQIMIASPGMESDAATPRMRENFLQSAGRNVGAAGRALGDIGDIALNPVDALGGTSQFRQTNALHDYIGQLEQDLRRGEIQVQVGGQTRTLRMGPDENIRDRVVLAGHSSGTIPAMTLSGEGYNSFLVEPRAYTEGLENRMRQNLNRVGHQIGEAEFERNFNANAISLRSSVPNIWNSALSTDGQFHGQALGQEYVYHRNGATRSGNDTIMGQHRVEESVPGLLNFRDATEFAGNMSLIANAMPGQAVRDFAEQNSVQAARNISAPVLQP